jgi:hypothetical protein
MATITSGIQNRPDILLSFFMPGERLMAVPSHREGFLTVSSVFPCDNCGGLSAGGNGVTVPASVVRQAGIEVASYLPESYPTEDGQDFCLDCH